MLSDDAHRKTEMLTSQDYLADLNSLQLIGLAGFVLYIYAFSAVQFGWLNGNSAIYSLVNVAAATCVAISLFADFNLASALIQGSWIVIGLTGLALRMRKGATVLTGAQS